MEQKMPTNTILEGEIIGIKFGLAAPKEIYTASINECSISHSSQLTNPFLGLPLEFGKCESCGTSEPGECEGHFGYIELPVPIYHPNHVSELKRMLSLLCLKCLNLKRNKFQRKNNHGVADRLLSCCEEASPVSIKECTTDGACFLQLKVSSRQGSKEGIWNFLERYGFRYGYGSTRTLLPCEVVEMLKRIPQDTRKKLARKGYFPQDGYVLRYLPVPPNCLSMPDISDGVSVMSSDLSISILKRVLKQVEIIKSSRSGEPNFESHEVEAMDLQSAVEQYLQVRGTGKAARDVGARFGISKESSESSTKAWLEKMKTLFIRKGCGFSSRSVITGDAYKQVNEIGIPYEIAQRITLEERVNEHNIGRLQKLVDEKMCLTYRDGSSTFSLREGSKGHTYLRPGQVVHRRIMDGDTVFINRPPTTHKHSLQALSAYVHDDHTVKINPLICGPLSADFDGDCIHLFYPQSLAAKAEVLELFSIEKQLLSSHSGNLNLQLTTDSLLSLKKMLKTYLLDRATTHQLAMYVSFSLPPPALLKARHSGPHWTALQILQKALPACFHCIGDRYWITKGEILEFHFHRDLLQSTINEVVTSIFFESGPPSVLQFFNFLQPMLMESIFSRGFSVGLEDFCLSMASRKVIQEHFKAISPLLCNLRSTYNEVMKVQLEDHIRLVRKLVTNFVLKSDVLGDLIDAKSDSAITKVVQQIGFLGLQISDRGKLYSKALVDDMACLFDSKYPANKVDHPSLQYGLVDSCFFHGLDPYEEMVHSISSREVIVRSSRGLSEPGTLFKNLMAILRDVVICYDGTVRNSCSNSVIQFEYMVNAGTKSQDLFPAGEPVGVLAATAMSNPAYKAVLESTPSSNSSWELMKEILLCKASFKNDSNDRRVIVYLNDCDCGRKYCKEKGAYLVKKQLEKVRLKDVANCFLIQYRRQQNMNEHSEIALGLVGHIHLQKIKLQDLNPSMQLILQKCEDTIKLLWKKKKIGYYFKRTKLSISECCSFDHHSADELQGVPCLMFCYEDNTDIPLENLSDIFADVICPVLLETIIKGDHRISSANIIWVSPETTPWSHEQGELALDIIVEKSAVKQSGDAWRTVLDACLPVFHLIDTRRSIPYAIKQVQELLGISCAFEQAVQRLSTSVTMVAKGVLKEHLILLGNSMTCTGDLIGFNSGGYKALSRSLDIQVPFTEATLFTPKRCFERAAEKCHVDSLQSTVAACSWGKHVAVGTGSRFDVLWDTKMQACFNQEDSIDVYHFLNMVKTATDGESIAACLGGEIDDLMLEDDWNLSPEHNPDSEKPSFDDSIELQNFSNDEPIKSGWEKTSQPNAWSSWGKDKAEEEGEFARSGKWNAGADWGSKGEETEKLNAGAEWGNKATEWGAKKAEAESDADWGRKGKEAEKLGSGAAWGNEASEWGAKKAEPKSDAWSMGADWGKAAEKLNASAAWGNEATEWGAKRAEPRADAWSAGADWGSKDKAVEKSNAGAAWGNEVTEWGARRAEPKSHAWSAGADWGSKGKAAEKSNAGAASGNEASEWGAKKAGPKSFARADWEEQMAEARDGIPEKAEDYSKHRGKAAESKNAGAAWGRMDKEANRNAAGGWGSEETEGGPQKAEPKSDAWSNSRSQKAETRNSGAGWGSKDKEAEKRNAGGGRGREQTEWGPQKTELKSDIWSKEAETSDVISQTVEEDSSKLGGWNAVSGCGSKGRDAEKQARNVISGSTNDDEATSFNQWIQPSAWDSKNSQDQPSSPWAASTPQVASSKSKGWAQRSGDFRSRKGHPVKSPGIGNDESGPSGLYTMTRQRLDIFTSEEQDILSEVEHSMQSIRRIMHQSGYNDGDPLSTDDQSYVLDNVFTHHPDKAVKMGSGIGHVTVSRHSSFQESRCFYIVSTDGSRQDFSYRKCLENYLKGKYPELAEDFISKYFARRPGGNRQRTPVPEGGGDEARQ